MPLPLSDFPAHRAFLRRVGGVDVRHGQASGFGFVGHKPLKLPESPAMQSRPNQLPGLDVGPDVGQILHADFTRTGTDCFGNDGLADFVVHCFNMPRLTPRDSLKFALCGAATVGLETTAMGKVDVPVVPQLPAAPDLAGTAGREVIFTNVEPENATTSNGRRIRDVEAKVEVPDALANDELGVLGGTTGEQVELVLPADERNLDASREREQRKRIAIERVSSLVEVHGRRPEGDGRNRRVLGDAFIGLERLVGVSDPVDGLAYHLAAKLWKLLAHGVVGHVVERHAVPAPVFNSERNNSAARTGKRFGQSRQRRRLIGGCKQLQGNGTLHICKV